MTLNRKTLKEYNNSNTETLKKVNRSTIQDALQKNHN